MKRLAMLTLIGAAIMMPAQSNPACPGTPTCQFTQCMPGSHPVAECRCDGPSGPCHWVCRCEKD